MLDDISKKLSDYFSALPDHIAIDPNVVSYDKGYYYSTSKVLKDFEDQFIKFTTDNLNFLLNTLKNSTDLKQKVVSIHLLGWYQKPKETYEILKQYILDPVQEIRNAAARATFPQVASGLVDPDPDIYFKLLHMPSDYDKNKALGTILRSKLIRHITREDLKYIKNLTRHDLDMVSLPAKKILEKVKLNPS